MEKDGVTSRHKQKSYINETKQISGVNVVYLPILHKLCKSDNKRTIIKVNRTILTVFPQFSLFIYFTYFVHFSSSQQHSLVI